MENKDKIKEELDYRTDVIALELFDAWQCYYLEWFPFDEYIVQAVTYLKKRLNIIKEEVENADDEE